MTCSVQNTQTHYHAEAVSGVLCYIQCRSEVTIISPPPRLTLGLPAGFVLPPTTTYWSPLWFIIKHQFYSLFYHITQSSVMTLQDSTIRFSPSDREKKLYRTCCVWKRAVCYCVLPYGILFFFT